MKMPALTQQNLIIGGVALVVLFVALKGFKGAAKATTKAAVNLADGAIAGTVVGVGEAFGIPDTNQTQCEKDLAAGNKWAASFSCPAGIRHEKAADIVFHRAQN